MLAFTRYFASDAKGSRIGAGYRRVLVVRSERDRVTVFEPGSLAFQTLDADDLRGAQAWPYDPARIRRAVRRRLKAAGADADWIDRKRVKRVLQLLDEEIAR